MTRTIMQGKHGVHFLEDSQHTRVKHVQTYTPVMLNRVPAPTNITFVRCYAICYVIRILLDVELPLHLDLFTAYHLIARSR
eukprot:COSAG06_NODE_397_length_16244_cov_230.792320_6_plen_81_part_00